MRVTDLKSFIEKSNMVHGFKYDYSKSIYTASKDKIEIGCKDHGYFFQIARDHYNSKAGCPSCAGTKKLTKIEFELKAKVVHKNKYSYNLVKYKNNREKVEITCFKHGSFFQAPTDHLSGKGCNLCRNEERRFKNKIKSDVFFERCKAVHGNTYDYSQSVYKGMNEMLSINCRTHGRFTQKANCHQRGRGCSKCAKLVNHYNRNSFIGFCKKNGFGVVYLIKCYGNSEFFYKIGITSKLDILSRFPKGSMPYDFDIVSFVFCKAENAWNIEKKIHRDLCGKKYSPKINFNGKTECFSGISSEVAEFFGVSL